MGDKKMLAISQTRRTGFSLVELVVVIVIIAILAAMAIPRLSRGSAGAGRSAVMGDLAIIRNALNLYAAEHNSVYPDTDEATVTAQLTQYSDINGGTSATKVGAFIYGPYLQRVPPCPVGPNAGDNGIKLDNSANPPPVDEASGKGWVYNFDTGEWLANTDDLDEEGTAYNTY
jgi:prepilin-type N-terminal cleavage/methylation domain-containing protein